MMIAGFTLLAVAGYIVNNILFSVLMLVLIPIVFLIARFSSRFLANKVFRKHFLSKEGIPVNQYVKFGDGFEVIKSPGNQSHYDYERVTKIYETKNLLILQVGRLSRILLDKSNFVTGDFRTFPAYIREKCPAAKYLTRIGRAKV